jgi:hypothetical protein
LASSGETKF